MILLLQDTQVIQRDLLNAPNFLFYQGKQEYPVVFNKMLTHKQDCYFTPVCNAILVTVSPVSCYSILVILPYFPNHTSASELFIINKLTPFPHLFHVHSKAVPLFHRCMPVDISCYTQFAQGFITFVSDNTVLRRVMAGVLASKEIIMGLCILALGRAHSFIWLTMSLWIS